MAYLRDSHFLLNYDLQETFFSVKMRLLMTLCFIEVNVFIYLLNAFVLEIPFLLVTQQLNRDLMSFMLISPCVDN